MQQRPSVAPYLSRFPYIRNVPGLTGACEVSPPPKSTPGDEKPHHSGGTPNGFPLVTESMNVVLSALSCRSHDVVLLVEEGSSVTNSSAPSVRCLTVLQLDGFRRGKRASSVDRAVGTGARSGLSGESRLPSLELAHGPECGLDATGAASCAGIHVG